jgi:hypothetical protein
MDRRYLVLLLSFVLALGCHRGPDLKEISREGKITLQYQGKSLPLKVEVMDVYLIDPESQDKYPEKFDLHGADLQLVGSFPMEIHVGYGEKFESMVGHSVFISSSENPSGHGDAYSNVTLRDGSKINVTGGTIRVLKVHGENPAGSGKIISGNLRLDLENGSSAEGDFVFVAKTWG